MSLAGLMSGAECAVEVNPLSQVLKHTVDGDRSLQQVRTIHPILLTSSHTYSGQDLWPILIKGQ
jgi:hypothetical protein